MEKIRFKYAVELIMGQSPEKESINYGGNGFPFLQGKADFGTISPTPTTWCDSPKKIAKKGDILLSVRAPVGDVNISNQEYAIGRGLCAIRAKKIDGRYCWYILQEINDTLHSFAVGTTYESVTVDDIANLTVPYPDGLVQKEIARYLDSKIGKIDELIENQEKQHNMLEQYKRELIANTITKGLNKSAPMKGSGVDWLGNVPEHWNVTKMKWMFEVVKRIYGAEDRDVLSITQRGIKVKDIDPNDGQLAESYANYQVVNVNDFAMNSMDLLTGWVDCSPYEGVTSPDYRVFRFHHDKPQCHTYYKYLFQMCYTNRIFYRLGQGVSNLGRWRLQADQFLNMKMPQPPIEEQEQIASYLDKKVGQIEELTADIKAQIEKLKEYRKIVIHDAVTEKIKVTEGE